MFSQNTWCCIFRRLPRADWRTVAQTCKAANKGLQCMMMNDYGSLNTWAYDCPDFVHRWKCEHHPLGSFIIIAPYPNAFENKEGSLYRNPEKIENNSLTSWRWPTMKCFQIQRKKSEINLVINMLQSFARIGKCF